MKITILPIIVKLGEVIVDDKYPGNVKIDDVKYVADDKAHDYEVKEIKNYIAVWDSIGYDAGRITNDGIVRIIFHEDTACVYVNRTDMSKKEIEKRKLIRSNGGIGHLKSKPFITCGEE